MDCGPTCLRMVAKHYGRQQQASKLRQIAGYSKEGVSLLGISEAAENMGFRTRGVQLSFKQLTEEAALPGILHWGQNHFVVLPPLTAKWKRGKRVRIADPAKGRKTVFIIFYSTLLNHLLRFTFLLKIHVSYPVC